MEDLGNINEEYNKDPTGIALKSKAAWDDESFTSAKLYSVEYSAPKNKKKVMQSVAEENTIDDKNTGASVVTIDNTEKESENEGYTLVGTGRNVKWEFLITPKTMNEELEKVSTTKLLCAVIKVEQQLGIKIQSGMVSIGP